VCTLIVVMCHVCGRMDVILKMIQRNFVGSKVQTQVHNDRINQLSVVVIYLPTAEKCNLLC
jgi:hypothetical protein